MTRVLLIHGTQFGDASPGDEETLTPWYEDDDVRTSLSRQVGTPLQFEVVHWPDPPTSKKRWGYAPGENKESARRRGGFLLAKRLQELDRAKEPFHVIAHSHGGSVLWEALKHCTRWTNPGGTCLPFLKSWTTVGTPFLGFRSMGLSWAWLAVVLILGTSLVIGPNWPQLLASIPLRETSEVDWSGSAIAGLLLMGLPIVGGLAVFSLFALRPLYVLWAGARDRVDRRLGRRAFEECKLGERWLCIWSSNDEAIQGLRLALSRSIEVPRMGTIRGSRLQHLLGALLSPVRLFYNRVAAPILDEFASHLMRQKAPGADLPGTRADSVSHVPPTVDDPTRYRPLNHAIDGELGRTADSDLAHQIAKLRILMGDLANQEGPVHELTDRIDWGHLVHTSYFKNAGVLKLIGQFVLDRSCQPAKQRVAPFLGRAAESTRTHVPKSQHLLDAANWMVAGALLLLCVFVTPWTYKRVLHPHTVHGVRDEILATTPGFGRLLEELYETPGADLRAILDEEHASGCSPDLVAALAYVDDLFATGHGDRLRIWSQSAERPSERLRALALLGYFRSRHPTGYDPVHRYARHVLETLEEFDAIESDPATLAGMRQSAMLDATLLLTGRVPHGALPTTSAAAAAFCQETLHSAVHPCASRLLGVGLTWSFVDRTPESLAAFYDELEKLLTVTDTVGPDRHLEAEATAALHLCADLTDRDLAFTDYNLSSTDRLVDLALERGWDLGSGKPIQRRNELISIVVRRLLGQGVSNPKSSCSPELMVYELVGKIDERWHDSSDHVAQCLEVKAEIVNVLAQYRAEHLTKGERGQTPLPLPPSWDDLSEALAHRIQLTFEQLRTRQADQPADATLLQRACIVAGLALTQDGQAQYGGSKKLGQDILKYGWSQCDHEHVEDNVCARFASNLAKSGEWRLALEVAERIRDDDRRDVKMKEVMTIRDKEWTGAQHHLIALIEDLLQRLDGAAIEQQHEDRIERLSARLVDPAERSRLRRLKAELIFKAGEYRKAFESALGCMPVDQLSFFGFCLRTSAP